LLVRAQEWQDAGRAANRLLGGQDVETAKAWLVRSPNEDLSPTELHRDFIQASDQAQTLRLSVERKRAETLQRAVKRTRIALAGACLFALLAAGAGFIARRNQLVAEDRRKEAETSRAEAQKSEAELLAEVLPTHRPLATGHVCMYASCVP
jgi:hypothetical protein